MFLGDITIGPHRSELIWCRAPQDAPSSSISDRSMLPVKKSHYPKADNRKEIEANLLGPCGFYCGFCLAYKKGVCLGCRYQAERSETKGIVNVFCDTLICATEKGLQVCAECTKHPCDRYDDEGDSIFSKLYIDYLKEAMKS